MKIDADYTYQIVKAVEDHPKPRMDRDALMKNLGVTKSDQSAMLKLYTHMNYIHEKAFFNFYPDIGFTYNEKEGAIVVHNYIEYEIKSSGRDFIKKYERNNRVSAWEDPNFSIFGNRSKTITEGTEESSES